MFQAHIESVFLDHTSLEYVTNQSKLHQIVYFNELKEIHRPPSEHVYVQRVIATF